MKVWLSDTEQSQIWIQNRNELRVATKIRGILQNILYHCPCLQCNPEMWADS